MHDTPPLMPLLRQALDKAEPYALIYAQQPHGALTYLRMLDEIHRLAEACVAQNLAVDAELVRRDSLLRRTKREAEQFVKALGSDSIPPDSTYGPELIALASTYKRQRNGRLARVTGVLVTIIALIVYAVVTTPPSADTTTILNEAVAGNLSEAYTLVKQESVAFPDDVETHVWLAVLAEQFNDDAVAQAAWQRLDTLVADQQQLVYMRGNVRLLAGDIPRALQDVEVLRQRAETLPEAIFLEAGIVEAQGDVDGAIALFRTASEQAELAGREEMSVLARVRMGNLMQYGIRATATPRITPAH